MKNSLQSKLILSYLAVALLTVLVVSVLIRLTSGRSLMNLIIAEQTATMKELAQEYYTSSGSFEGFFEYYLQAAWPKPPFGMPQPEPSGQQPDEYPEPPDIRGLAGMVDASYQAVVPGKGYTIGDTVPENMLTGKIPVEVDGQTVAWILPDTSFQFRLSAEEQIFLQRTTLAIGLAALAGVLAALAIGFLLTGRLLQPIRQLTQAAQGLARGQLNQQVLVTSGDELGLLTAAFNQMSADLEQADQQRKRITADVTHDLSTPLQIISGYVEMLEEGEVTLTPERIEIIKTELGNLRRLVGDLSTLTQVEAGALEIQSERVQPARLLERVCGAFQPIAERQEVDLELVAPADLPDLLVDEGRLGQVLKNLLENALRHTPKGGKIQIGARAGSPVQLWVADSGEGIDPEDLPYVFERFYRADRARGGNSGKMGLGLAISKALVSAQGGSISAASAGPGLGTTITINLPAAGEMLKSDSPQRHGG